MQIALDGFSSCGKSTLAHDLAKKLGWIHIDSGAFYRSISLYLLNNSIDLQNPQLIEAALNDIRFDYAQKGCNLAITMNGQVVGDEIRSKAVSEIVSPVATLGVVRQYVVCELQQVSEQMHVVMDGRDIGTVVFPDAFVKFFIVADMDVRVDRRYKELQQKNMARTRAEIKANLEARDHIDSNRNIAPLTKAPDAIVLDTSQLDRAGQLAKAYSYVENKLEA